MQYLSFVMRLALILIGLYLLVTANAHPDTQCAIGLAIFITGLYLGLQGKFGSKFTGCIFDKTEKRAKKKGFFG